MALVRLKTVVTCNKCKIIYEKRQDTLVGWSGKCRSCCNKTNKLGKIYSIKQSCISCGKESRWIKKQQRCKECFILYKFITPEATARWKKDRTLLKVDNTRNDSAYKDWRKNVWSRDKFTCRIADNNCDGRIEAHHILAWSAHPELRYQVNNGITLCHAHHPRARAEEKRLIPTFQELVAVSK